VVNTLPQYGGQGCKALGIEPTRPPGGDNPIPELFNPLPETKERFPEPWTIVSLWASG
jgi:phospholipase C